MADCPILDEILRQAPSQNVARALVAGVVMESGSLCGPYPSNPSSGACGPFQYLPCEKTGCNAHDWACQVRYAISEQGYAGADGDPYGSAFRAERPEHFYGDNQLNMAARTLQQVFGGAAPDLSGLFGSGGGKQPAQPDDGCCVAGTGDKFIPCISIPCPGPPDFGNTPVVGGIGTIIGHLLDRKFWERIGEFMLGLWLVGAGILLIALSSKTVQNVIVEGGKAAVAA